MHFVVLRRTGPSWQNGVRLEDQEGFAAHAAFMDRLADEGTVLLGGPLANERRVVLVMAAGTAGEVRALLEQDPWHGSHLELDSIEAWTLRLRAPLLRDLPA